MRGRGGPITAAADVPGDRFRQGNIDGVRPTRISSKRPSASLERVKSLMFVVNRSTIVRGTQAIVILAFHMSPVCTKTTPFSIAPRPPRPHGNRARSLSRVYISTTFEPISTTVFSGGLPPVIAATIQPKIGETSVKNHFSKMKGWHIMKNKGNEAAYPIPISL